MFATFICKNCNTKIIIDFSKSDKIHSSCSKCGSVFVNSHYINSFADKFMSLQRSLSNLEFCGLSSGNSDLFNLVYKSDIESLNELYAHSSINVKELLACILDTNFLMVYHAAKDEDLKTLKEYADKLKTIFEQRVSCENEKTMKLFDVSED